MTQMQAKDTKKIASSNKEEAQRIKLIANEWRDFSKTTAFKEFQDYIELQDYLAITGAKGPINTFDEEEAAKISFDAEKAAHLLQRSVAYDIVRLYVDGYVNFTSPSA